VTTDVDLKEFVGGFVAEGEQIVADSTAWLLEIERANAAGELRPKTVRDLFRGLHTIKGLAGMMGVAPIVELAHALETVLRTADQSGGRLGPRAVELGIICIRAIAERVRAVADNRPVPPAPENVLEELARVDVAGASAPVAPIVAASWDKRLTPGERAHLASALEAGRRAYTVTFAPSDETASRRISIATVRTAIAVLGEIVKVAPRSEPASERAPAGLVFELLVVSDASPEALGTAAATTVDRVSPVIAEVLAPANLEQTQTDDSIAPVGRAVVRVELARLDDLQDQLSALVVSRFRLEREIAVLASRGTDARTLREVVEQQGRQLRDLRRAVLRARMVRVAEALEPLTLLARSLSRPGVKEVKLEIDVRDSELDKAVADRVFPALVHLVRNAVDHAIEPVVEREAAGKPPAGRIRIATREGAGNELQLVVSDDGRGIDRAAVARRAGASIDGDHELLAVLATPGFSTRDTATETSGRGFGMDIVNRIVTSELGGELRLATTPGAGTTFTLEVPLTIALVDVFSFECAAQLFAVPVAAVEEIFELSDHAAMTGPSAPDRLPVAMIERRGKPLPIVPLGMLLRLRHDPGTATKGVVIRRLGESLAFAVDRMLGRHEVVVRPIDDTLGRAPGIAGATDLGDGRPTLLLDLVELGARVASWREARPS
jgi:two-component system chemotaxis sensor kinase CheA